MNKEEREKMIERVKALLRLGNTERNDSEAEAETAAKKAQELIEKYNIDMSEVENVEQVFDDVEIVNETAYTKRSTKATWEGYLSSAVGVACETKPYIYTDSEKVEFRFIGTEWDVAISKELYVYLHGKMTSLSRRKYPGNNKYQRDYLNGFVIRIMQRIEEQKENDKKKNIQNTGYALVLKTKQDKLEQWADENLNLRKGRRTSIKRHNQAFGQGFEDGKNVDIGTDNRIKEQKRNQLNG